MKEEKNFGTFDQDDRFHLIVGAGTTFIVGCGLSLAVVQFVTITLAVVR